MTTPARPNLFVVGAAKAGTTAMSIYLGAHPEIFMSPVKAPSYFARELGVDTAYSRSLDRYLSLFAEGRAARYRGEASPSHLFDPGAAQAIRDFAPDARIIILLRNPIEAMQAVHGEARKYAIEPRRRFAAALAASDRGRPRLVARPGGFWTRYRDVVRYAGQVERYLEAFPREQIFFGFYDDFRADPGAFYRSLLEFLGVDPDFRPEFERLNPYRGDVRSHLLQRVVIARSVAAGTTGAGPARLVRLRTALAQWNITPGSREPLSGALREDLVADLRPDVERLSALTGRDLSGWLDGP